MKGTCPNYFLKRDYDYALWSREGFFCMTFAFLVLNADYLTVEADFVVFF